MSQGTRMMDSIDIVSSAAKLTDRLKEFANGTDLPRSLIVNDTELESLAASAITPLLWSLCIESHLELAVSVRVGFNPDMLQWIISIRSPKEAPTLGEMSSLSTSAAIYRRVPNSTTNISNTPKCEGYHGTG